MYRKKAATFFLSHHFDGIRALFLSTKSPFRLSFFVLLGARRCDVVRVPVCVLLYIYIASFNSFVVVIGCVDRSSSWKWLGGGWTEGCLWKELSYVSPTHTPTLLVSSSNRYPGRFVLCMCACFVCAPRQAHTKRETSCTRRDVAEAVVGGSFYPE